MVQLLMFLGDTPFHQTLWPCGSHCRSKPSSAVFPKPWVPDVLIGTRLHNSAFWLLMVSHNGSPTVAKRSSLDEARRPKDKYLEASQTLCCFSEVVVVGCPLRSLSSRALDSRLGFGYQALFPFVGLSLKSIQRAVGYHQGMHATIMSLDVLCHGGHWCGL